MRKLSLFLLFSSGLLFANAQLVEVETGGWTTIGKINRLGTTIAKMEYKTNGADTVYSLLMKDFTKQQEPNYFSISFSGTGNSFARFYTLFKSFFISENKSKNYMKTFRLGEYVINLQHTALIGAKAVRLSTRESYINLSEKDIDRIFGYR
ncbi:MAG: hypothetical protein EOO06_07000 [Chitinophagaceae bacterium]|nr:MAG: hypothetical protein EOO06_07000 [Chitinophagaceae bacterium]